MTSFSGLRNASSALNAERYAMQIAGQNIANADTPGYTRERADLVATGPVAGVTRLYSVADGTPGTVNATGASRLNDVVIDARARTEHARSGYFDTKAATISNVETGVVSLGLRTTVLPAAIAGANFQAAISIG